MTIYTEQLRIRIQKALDSCIGNDSARTLLTKSYTETPYGQEWTYSFAHRGIVLSRVDYEDDSTDTINTNVYVHALLPQLERRRWRRPKRVIGTTRLVVGECHSIIDRVVEAVSELERRTELYTADGQHIQRSDRDAVLDQALAYSDSL